MYTQRKFGAQLGGTWSTRAWVEAEAGTEVEAGAAWAGAGAARGELSWRRVLGSVGLTSGSQQLWIAGSSPSAAVRLIFAADRPGAFHSAAAGGSPSGTFDRPFRNGTRGMLSGISRSGGGGLPGLLRRLGRVRPVGTHGGLSLVAKWNQ